MSTEIFDPSQRRLCPDGTCVGVLDSNGRCSECNQGERPDAAEPAIVSTAPVTDGFSPDRRLCADGTCVGVIAANNRCSICGTVAA